MCGTANATAAGGVFLSCNHGDSVCGSNDANMLACSAMPNGYVSCSSAYPAGCPLLRY
jgi:hypothetical protein